MKVEVRRFVVVHEWPYESATIKYFDAFDDAVREFLKRGGPQNDDVHLFAEPAITMSISVSTDEAG